MPTRTAKTKKTATKKAVTDSEKPTKKVEKETKVKAKKTSTKVEENLASAIQEEKEETSLSQAAKGGSFIPAVGRRKTAVARVRLIKNGKGEITINGKKFDKYFTTYDLREQIESPLKISGQETSVDVSVKVTGGGIRGQAEAVRHGLSRALIQLNPTFRKTLKKLGYLKRDARKRERKKFGLKGARRAPQWSKR